MSKIDIFWSVIGFLCFFIYFPKVEKAAKEKNLLQFFLYGIFLVAGVLVLVRHFNTI